MTSTPDTQRYFTPAQPREYADALVQSLAALSSVHLQMLAIQRYAPERTVTAKQLATALGYTSFYGVNLHYGKLGRLIAAQLGRQPRAEGWWSVLSEGGPSADGYRWRMHQSLADALDLLGWFFGDGDGVASPSQPPGALWEGAARTVQSTVYERSPEARRLCLAHHGSRCAVCGMDFGQAYGPAAAGFIHVHHVTPLSRRGASYQVDPARDLRPVCPNCHAVIHLREPPYSIDEVQAMHRETQAG